MKKLLIGGIGIVVIALAYYLAIVMPHTAQQHNYEDCVKNSITEEEATRYNYTGGIRNDKTNPKTCIYTYGQEVFTESTENKWLP